MTKCSPGRSPEAKADLVGDLLDDRGQQLENTFTVIDPAKVRMRPLGQ